MAYNLPKPTIVIAGPEINLKNTGNTVIFTTQDRFIPLLIFFLAMNLSGSIGSPVVNVGWTATAYDDLTDGMAVITTVNGEYSGQDAFTGFGPPCASIPPATQLRVNVTSADTTATTNIQKFYVVGHYI